MVVEVVVVAAVIIIFGKVGGGGGGWRGRLHHRQPLDPERAVAVAVE